MRLELRQPVRCTDDLLGELADVVIDPVSRRVTHLVVQPPHRHDLARLVPVELAQDDHAEVSLACTVEEARRLPAVQETAYLRVGEAPVEDPNWDVGLQAALALPYYPLDPAGEYVEYTAVSYDRIPKAEVEIRRASAVRSADGHDVGHVDGFVLDPEGEAITHLVLERGHLWGKRDVTVPIGAVEDVATDLVTLSLTRQEVGELPAVRVHRWHR